MTGPKTTDLDLQVSPNPGSLGVAAGKHAARVLVAALATRERVRLMLAAAPSQQATLAELRSHAEVDFSRVECFHMDDYIGLEPGAPQSFSLWLQRHFTEHVDVAAFHQIDPTGTPADEAIRYAQVLGAKPFDLLLCGLGVNGHLAFNDPPADFEDAEAVRVVDLDPTSRQQQVDEGHFPVIDAVPAQAITVTIPRLLNTRTVICSVPGSAKRQAVTDTLTQPVSGEHPGTALRTHPDAHLYLDTTSCPDETASQ